MAHTSAVPDPKSNDSILQKAEKQKVFSKILISTAVVLRAFGSEVHRFQTEKGLDCSSQSFGSLVCLEKTDKLSYPGRLYSKISNLSKGI